MEINTNALAVAALQKEWRRLQRQAEKYAQQVTESNQSLSAIFQIQQESAELFNAIDQLPADEVARRALALKQRDQRARKMAKLDTSKLIEKEVAYEYAAKEMHQLIFIMKRNFRL